MRWLLGGVEGDRLRFENLSGIPKPASEARAVGGDHVGEGEAATFPIGIPIFDPPAGFVIDLIGEGSLFVVRHLRILLFPRSGRSEWILRSFDWPELFKVIVASGPSGIGEGVFAVRLDGNARASVPVIGAMTGSTARFAIVVERAGLVGPHTPAGLVEDLHSFDREFAGVHSALLADHRPEGDACDGGVQAAAKSVVF
jgi:hypothetical protein